jgi:hypothetical protein
MIKQDLERLKPEERRLLQYAFENGFPQHVMLPGNRFIGVHADKIRHLDIEERAGVWSTGKVKG